jgi:uncharacterized phage infection (PIP) family protein YhgE
LQPKNAARRSPPAPAAAPEPPTETQKPAEPATAATATEEPVEVPAASAAGTSGPDETAMKQLSQLGDQLDAAAARLADAASDFESRKKDRNEATTEDDDKLKDEIDTLRAATTRFNRRVNASALRRVTWRLRREGEAQSRVEVVERVREIDEVFKRVQHLLGQVKADEPVLTVWQEVRRIGRQINQLCRR